MRAEPALTERISRGRRHGASGAGSKSWRGRLEESAALLAPVGAVVGLALAGGGFEVGSRHVAGLIAWLVVVALIVVVVLAILSPARRIVVNKTPTDAQA